MLVITTLSKDVEFAFWCMFACKDFKELSEAPSGTKKKVAGEKKKSGKKVFLLH